MAPGPRLLWLAGVPLAWALLLVFHPNGGASPYDMIDGKPTAFLVVHVGSAIMIPLVAITVVVLLHDLSGRAAWIGRWAMAPFLVFYLGFEAVTGIGSGVLVNEGGEKELVNDFYSNPIAGDPSVFSAIGGLSWVVGLIAAGIAVRKAGSPLGAAILVGIGAIAAAHPFPIGPIGLTCLAAGAVLYERSRTRPPASQPAYA